MRGNEQWKPTSIVELFGTWSFMGEQMVDNYKWTNTQVNKKSKQKQNKKKYIYMTVLMILLEWAQHSKVLEMLNRVELFKFLL